MADDSESDRFFVQRALDSSGVGIFFRGVNDGQEAITYLQGKKPFEDRHEFPFPNILLVDLKMPGMDGFDLLRWLRANPGCQVIPTIVFSSSGIESDVHQAYALGANAFIVKPTSPGDLTRLIQLMYQFWSQCQIPAVPAGERCT